MKNIFKVLSPLCAITLAAVIGFGLASCDNGGGGNPATSAAYTGGNYKLVISQAGRAAYSPKTGDNYVLTIVSDGKTSRGTITIDGSTFELTPTNSDTTFNITVSGGNITAIFGTITLDDGTVLDVEKTFTGGGDNGGITIGETNGKLTITGIPAEYNGKYAFARNRFDPFAGEDEIYAAASMAIDETGFANFIITGGQIVNGEVTLKVWKATGDYSIGNYNGTASDSLVVYIISTTTFNSDGAWVAIAQVPVAFTNGQGTGTGTFSPRD